MSCQSPISTATQPTLDDGDAAAKNGRWFDAVTIWADLRTGPSRRAAERRLSWFLGQTGQEPGRVRAFVPGSRTLLLAAALGILGTAIVLVGEGQAGTASVAISIAAWTCYAATGVLIVMYAYAGYRAERARTHLDDADVSTALAIARSLDGDIGPGVS